MVETAAEAMPLTVMPNQLLLVIFLFRCNDPKSPVRCPWHSIAPDTLKVVCPSSAFLFKMPQMDGNGFHQMELRKTLTSKGSIHTLEQSLNPSSSTYMLCVFVHLISFSEPCGPHLQTEGIHTHPPGQCTEAAHKGPGSHKVLSKCQS